MRNIYSSTFVVIAPKLETTQRPINKRKDKLEVCSNVVNSNYMELHEFTHNSEMSQTLKVYAV